MSLASRSFTDGICVLATSPGRALRPMGEDFSPPLPFFFLSSALRNRYSHLIVRMTRLLGMDSSPGGGEKSAGVSSAPMELQHGPG